jgi:hypothetical protein
MAQSAWLFSHGQCHILTEFSVGRFFLQATIPAASLRHFIPQQALSIRKFAPQPASLLSPKEPGYPHLGPFILWPLIMLTFALVQATLDNALGLCLPSCGSTSAHSCFLSAVSCAHTWPFILGLAVVAVALACACLLAAAFRA